MREEAHLAAEDHQSIYFLKMTLLLSQRSDKLKNPLLQKSQLKIAITLASLIRIYQFRTFSKSLNKLSNKPQSKIKDQ